MRELFFAAAVLIALCSPAAAFPHGTATPGNPDCPHAAAGFADGCAGANQAALFKDTSFFSTARQSGQTQYKDANGTSSNHPPAWDVAGVDYPVGRYTVDASMLNPVTSPASGCSYSSSLVALQCGGDAVVKHYWFNGVNLYLSGAGKSLVLDDVRVTMTANNCRTFNGTAPVNTLGPVIVTNSTFDFGDDCRVNAQLYKQLGDPGLVTQSNFTGTFTSHSYLTQAVLVGGVSGTSLTRSALTSGEMSVGDFLQCSGCGADGIKIIAVNGSSTVWTLASSPGTIAPGTTMYIYGGEVVVGTGSTGIMAKGQYVDFSGRPTSDFYSETFQLDWLSKWKGTGHTSGTSFVVDSTDASSPNSLPAIGDVLTCGGCGVNGTPITSGSAGTYTMSASVGTNATGTPLMTALTKCVASACDGALWETTRSLVSAGAVAGTTGPIEAIQNGGIFAGGKVEGYYNANFGWGQWLNGGNSADDLVVKYNYSEIVSRISQHVNYVIKQPNAAFPAGALMQNYVVNFNTVWWTKNSWYGTGTGTIDLFTTYTNGGPAMMVTDLFQAKNNVVITNLTQNGNISNGHVTNALFRYLSQGGGTVATVNGSIAAGVMTITSRPTGRALLVGDFIGCQTCASPVQITSFGTGTGDAGTYNITNTTDTMNLVANTGVALYPGQINTLDWSQNYVDYTGADGVFTEDKGNIPVGTRIFAPANINMKTGATCTPGGSC